LSSEDSDEKTGSTGAVAEKEKTAKSRMVVSVRDISCVTCGLAIEKQVKKIKGVEDVKTAVMLNKVFIDYNPKLVDSSTIRKAVDKTGYKTYLSVEEKKR
jgi:Cu+-exporting ATPase